MAQNNSVNKTSEDFTVDNLKLDGNSLTSTTGNLNLTPVAGSSAIIDGHWGFDGTTMTAQTDANTTITAYAGKNISIESTTFDGGVVAPNGAYTLPTADGTAGYVLKTDGSGAVSWASTPSSSGVVIQQVSTVTTASVLINTIIPVDATTPQKTEGNEVITLAITPTSATNKLVFNFSCTYGVSNTTALAVALFKDNDADSLFTTFGSFTASGTSSGDQCALNFTMTSGTTSSTTFKIRMGPYNSITSYANRNSTGLVRFGGTMATSFTITEIQV